VTQATTGATEAAAPDALASDRRSWLPGTLLLAVVAYVPFLLSAPGRVSADTKQYLYLDPGRLLADAPYLWDSGYGAGTLTHQNIGYLFPMGPFFWLFDTLGIPDWVAQRLWLGTIVFAAGAGVLFLLRTLRWHSRWTALASAFVYMLTPYQLAYTGRISAILLPWAGLPWMIALTARALRRGGWREPALFALVSLTVGSTNATSLLLVGLAPVLWLVFAVVNGDSDAKRAVGVAARIGVLCFFTSLWWIAGLVLQGGYGINYLDVSETVRTVAEGSSPTEVLRGLGNWFFYGGDAVGPWIPQAVDFTQKTWLLGASFLLPLLAFGAAAVTRWRHRAYFVVLLVIGTVAAVGAFPYDGPSPLGALFKSWATGSTAGLAMRSTPRAVPLVALAIAVLLAAGLDAWAARTTRVLRTVAVVGVVGLTLLTFVPVWRDGYIAERNSREDVPTYWEEATAALEREGSSTRVLEIPGSPSAAYRWGATSDPITPGLMDRPWVARELIPYFGSPAAASLAIALDHRMQEGTFEPDSLAPVARLLSSGTVLLRSDLEWERSDTPRPRMLWGQLTDPLAAGLGPPRDFGPGVPNVATRFPVLDEIELRTPSGAASPPEVALFGVSDVPSILHTATMRQPVLVAGDGEGLVDLAAAGLIDGTELILYSASFADDRAGFDQALDDGADLVVSDTNRRRAQRWGSIRDATGRTERAGETPAEDDPEDKRLEVFPGSDDSDRSVVEDRGPVPVEVTATGYGERSIYAPDQRPTNALDGDPSTAWRVGGEDDPAGERLIVDLPKAAMVNRITLRQPDGQPGDRFITKARLHLDDEAIDVDLGDASRAGDGQVVTFQARPVRHLEIEIFETNTGELASYGGTNGVGFANVVVSRPTAPPPIAIDEVVRMPTRLLREAGAASLDHSLVLLMSRLGYEPASTRRQAEEPAIARRFELPTLRSFALTGQARVDANAPDPSIDAVLGTTAVGATFDASGHLRGDANARASRAFDADPDTAWVAPVGEQVGQWVGTQLGAPVTLSGLELQVVADGQHSVPTRLRLEVDGETERTIDLPPIANPGPESAVTSVPVSFEPITGSSFQLFVDAVSPVTTRDARTSRDRTLPVAIASVGMTGVPAPADPSEVDGCRDGALTIDDEPVAIRVSGDARSAANGRALSLEACDAGAVELDAGSHVVRTAQRGDTGLDVDRLVLGSAPGGGPRGPGLLGPKDRASGAKARVTDEGLTHVDGRLRTDGDPFWLVLGQSENKGWELDVDGDAKAGVRTLVNGYANGWRITPDGAGTLTIGLRWTPQGLVWWAIGISVLALLVCIGLVLRRRGGPPPEEAAVVDEAPAIASPLESVGDRPSAGVMVATAVGAAVVAGIAAAPWIGVVVGLATAAALRWPRARSVLTVGSVVAFALAAAYVIVQQARHGYPTISSWPSRFEDVAALAWLAVFLLGADVVVQWIRRAAAESVPSKDA
jgi:hypothetical protein